MVRVGRTGKSRTAHTHGCECVFYKSLHTAVYPILYQDNSTSGDVVAKWNSVCLGKAYMGLLLCPCDFHHKPAQRDTSRSNLLKIKLTDDHIVNTTQKRNFLIFMNPLFLLNIIILSVYVFACHFNRAIVAITWGNNVPYSNVILGVKCNTLRRSKMALGGKMKHWHIGRQLLWCRRSTECC